MGIRTEMMDGVFSLVLEDGDSGNTIDVARAEALAEAVAAVPRETRCVLLQSEGRNFCLGGDVAAFTRGEDPAAALRSIVQPFHQAVLTLSELDQPVVVALHGWAAGAGFSLALAGDVLIVGDDARCKTAYNRLGLTPDGGLTRHLALRVSPALARDLLLTDRTLAAGEMVSLGLASRLVASDQVLVEARKVASEIATGSVAANKTALRLLEAAPRRQFADQLAAEEAAIAAAAASEDGSEGVQAFLERRPARFG